MIVSKMNVASVVAVLAVYPLVLVFILVNGKANMFNMCAFIIREGQDETKTVMVVVFMVADGVRLHWAKKPNQNRECNGTP